MAYRFTVHVNGQDVHVELPHGTAEHIPDGTYDITGHTGEDGTSHQFRVVHTRPDGTVTAMAEFFDRPVIGHAGQQPEPG